MERWKSRGGKRQRREEKRKRREEKSREERRGEERRREEKKREEKESEESIRRKNQKKEDAGAGKGKSRETLCFSGFPMGCGSGRSKRKLAKAAGAEPSGWMRDEKLHTVVARSAFESQRVKMIKM